MLMALLIALLVQNTLSPPCDLGIFMDQAAELVTWCRKMQISASLA